MVVDSGLTKYRDPLMLPQVLLALTDTLNRATESGSLLAQFYALDEMFHILTAIGMAEEGAEQGQTLNTPVIDMALRAQRQSFRVWRVMLDIKIKNLKNELITSPDITAVSGALISISRFPGGWGPAGTHRIIRPSHTVFHPPVNDNIRKGQAPPAEIPRLPLSLHNGNICLLGCTQTSKRPAASRAKG